MTAPHTQGNYERPEIGIETRQGIEAGIPLSPTPPDENKPTVLDQPDVVTANLMKEVALGRVAGTFANPPLPNVQVSPGISIAWQELFALVVACHLWGSTFSKKRIIFQAVLHPKGNGLGPSPDPSDTRVQFLLEGQPRRGQKE